SPVGGPPLRNWERVLSHVAEEPPDLVVHTGDLLLHEPDHDENHVFVRAQLDRLAAPWCAVPGNHDVGDGPPQPWFGEAVTEQRLARYAEHWGADHWARPLGDWLLVGLNSILLGTGLAAEAAQLRWLDALLADNRHRPIAVFLHKPLFLASAGDDSSSDQMVPVDARRSVLERLAVANVRLVASGHCHEYRTCLWRGIAFVWAPTTAFITKKQVPGPAGLRRAGVVRYVFTGEAVSYRFVEPAGIEWFDNSFLHRRRKALGLPYNEAVLAP
ncbi:MAG: metallophosphoesterase, partial [Alphaproteobacteria bacterium]|nr:metallophosphoesterase [Alphaproteobacteria bacterium]